MISILWRELRTLSHSLLMVIFHFVTPLFLLVFFAAVFARNLQSFPYQGHAVSYVDYFTPGLVGYVTFMTFQMALTFVRHDRASGMLGIVTLAHGGLDRYLIAKVASQAAINASKSAILVVLALLMSDAHVSLWQPWNMGLFAIAIILGSIIWTCLGTMLGFFLGRDDVREVVVMLITMPIAFASSMYYDVSRAPAWIAQLSHFNPLTYICNVARHAYLSSDGSLISRDLYVLIVIAGITSVSSIFVSRHANVS